jgi:RNA polymerase sigma-70 factor, ECF subfamily
MTFALPLLAEVRELDLPENDSDEAELIRLANEGNARSFDALVRRHTARTFNFLFQMTRHRQDAEDLTQQTFIKAFHNLHRFDARRPMINWLLTIARRTALNHFRSSKKWEELPETASSPDPSPAVRAEDREEKENLWAQARRLLSPREFEVLWLRFGEEMSIDETSRIVGLTQTHVKVIVFRARNHLIKNQKR